MQLYLIDSRHNPALFTQLLQMMNLEIAHADRPHTAFLIQALQGAPSILIFILARPMNQIEVNNIQPELLAACLKRLQRRIIALIGIPYFGGHEQTVPRHTASSNRLSDFFFVPVDGCGINAPVAQLKCGCHRISNLGPLRFVRAQTKPGHLYTIIQYSRICQMFHVAHSLPSSIDSCLCMNL
ncbi:hypothetical protein D3C73_1051750 [compost metagenome]